ncbi:hypothetical protein K474DRAFT_1448659 [Panus rudis PR-1116 ss-1]|nr:hypothetical protein K474DRAFT_1448659 [Panus rudis PR-1116 ss-1]
MSDNASQIIAALQNGQIDTRFLIATFGLLLYDPFLTFSREVSSIWSRQWSMVTVLYVINRYGALFDVLLRNITGQVWERTLAGCQFVLIASSFMDVLLAISFAAFSCLRVWVLYDRKWLPCLVVLLISSFAPVINIYLFSIMKIHQGMNSQGCYITQPPVYAKLPVITRASVVASDLLVVVFTWIKTVDQAREFRRLGQGTSVAAILLRNGIVQFLLLSSTNAVTMFLDIEASKVGPGTDFIYINNALTSIILARFILDLRDTYHGKPQLGNESLIKPDSTVQFVGPIGAPLENSLMFGAYEDYEDDRIEGFGDSEVIDLDEKSSDQASPESETAAGPSSAA